MPKELMRQMCIYCEHMGYRYKNEVKDPYDPSMTGKLRKAFGGDNGKIYKPTTAEVAAMKQLLNQSPAFLDNFTEAEQNRIKIGKGFQVAADVTTTSRPGNSRS